MFRFKFLLYQSQPRKTNKQTNIHTTKFNVNSKGTPFLSVGEKSNLFLSSQTQRHSEEKTYQTCHSGTSDKMTSLLRLLLSSAGTESWGACSTECPQIAFVAWWNVTLMTEQRKWYPRCIFYPGCHRFTIQEESQTQRLTHPSVNSPSKHSEVIGSSLVICNVFNHEKEKQICLHENISIIKKYGLGDKIFFVLWLLKWSICFIQLN